MKSIQGHVGESVNAPIKMSLQGGPEANVHIVVVTIVVIPIARAGVPPHSALTIQHQP
ncbi:hypothetical protein SDC9_130806 [bioreactor metagenome]|uniref:Uncharacterized protein n=1 Tax=bioreactor metagenome TaxID=1076179 RepID=A0A645D3J6_9ZZZZ